MNSAHNFAIVFKLAIDECIEPIPPFSRHIERNGIAFKLAAVAYIFIHIGCAGHITTFIQGVWALHYSSPTINEIDIVQKVVIPAIYAIQENCSVTHISERNVR